MNNISAIILAAGTSSRMGSVKQLLPLGNKPLLKHVIDKVTAEDFSEIIVVIGYESKNIKRRIAFTDERIRWVENTEYRSGQSSSLRCGFQNLKETDRNVMVFLGDLPFVSCSTIKRVYEMGQKQLSIFNEPFVIRPQYNDIKGHPVFFGRLQVKLFSSLQGDHGGKMIMKQISHQMTIEVEDEGILSDIDTPEAYEKAKLALKGFHF
ncbi:nucleotidyltransferase family protein [Niallia sp. XMNu-256]|uniref:nucleotidyltransferase family protein n=1 Tax=Niallia sp. XMNu-256 TaxID=3082444 RepID=UPI0030CE7518